MLIGGLQKYLVKVRNEVYAMEEMGDTISASLNYKGTFDKRYTHINILQFTLDIQSDAALNFMK